MKISQPMLSIIVIIWISAYNCLAYAADTWEPRELLTGDAYRTALTAIPEPESFLYLAPYGFLISTLDKEKAGYKTGFRKGDFLYAINNDMLMSLVTYDAYLRTTRTFRYVTAEGSYKTLAFKPGKMGSGLELSIAPQVYYWNLLKGKESRNKSGDTKESDPWLECAKALSYNLQLAESALARCYQHDDTQAHKKLNTILTFMLLDIYGDHDQRCLELIKECEGFKITSQDDLFRKSIHYIIGRFYARRGQFTTATQYLNTTLKQHPFRIRDFRDAKHLSTEIPEIVETNDQESLHSLRSLTPGASLQANLEIGRYSWVNKKNRTHLLAGKPVRYHAWNKQQHA
ncbi:MAG: hypothetical protein HRU15_06090, partial [Planctomycetes bacterium]|nr:hypothetical protein [Planctomycetota bacterium]